MPLDELPVNLAELDFTTSTKDGLMLEQEDPREAGETEVSRLAAKIAEAVRPTQRRMTQAEIAAAEEAELRERFKIVWPDEYAAMPEPTFWDPETEMIPKNDDRGATVIVSGKWGSHKTNVTLTWIMDAALNAGARVLYAAGEGSTGVGKLRIPAHCAARGISPEDLRGKLATVQAVPLLTREKEVEQFIAAYQEFRPQIIVLDTLATATAGEDENGSRFSSLLTDNGAVGQIKRAFRATVIVLAHEGKDENKGIRGHSGLAGNIDAWLRVTNAKGSPLIDVLVDKMRDGRSNFHTYYTINPACLLDRSIVPVPVQISEDEVQRTKDLVQSMEDKISGVEEAFEALRKFGPEGAQRKDWSAAVGQTGGTFDRNLDKLRNTGRVQSIKRGRYAVVETAAGDATVH
jgi:AAA domain